MQELQLADGSLNTSSTAAEAGRAAQQQRSMQPEPGPAEAAASSSSSSSDNRPASNSGSSSDSDPATAEPEAEDDPFAAPTLLHGPQRKAGPLAPREWLQPYALERHTEYMDYLEAWEQAHGANPPPSDELPPPQPVTFPTCQVWVVSSCGFRVAACDTGGCMAR